MDTLNIIIRLISKNYSGDAAFELAAGLKPKTVDSWKRGNSKGFLKILPKLSELFNVSTDYLLGNDQKNKPSPEEDGLTDSERLLLERFRKLTDVEQDMMLRAARSESDRMKKEDM